MPSFDVSALNGQYPFAPNYVEVDGGRLHYVDEGPRLSKALVMLHGNPTWSFFYRELIKALSAEHRVIALDHIGCGLSDKPETYRYTLRQHIENVEAVVNKLGLEEITLMVHDWGGAIGMGFAVRRPELIKRLVVFNTAAFPAPRIPFSIALCRVPGLGALAIRGLNAFARAALIRCVKHQERLTSEIRRGYLGPYHDWASRVANLRFVEDIPMKREHPSYGLLEEIGRELGQFADLPILICWGAKDFVFNDFFYEEWTKRFPQARKFYVEDAGHYLLEDAHERIVPCVATFLRETS